MDFRCLSYSFFGTSFVQLHCHLTGEDKEARREQESRDELMSCQQGFLTNADDNNHLFFTQTLQENDMFQGCSHTPKQDEPQNHPINSCLCATEDSRALTEWQQDEGAQTDTHTSGALCPLDIQRAAYVT